METIVIINFGAKSSEIAEQIRNCNVFTEIVKPTELPSTPVDQIKGIVLSNASASDQAHIYTPTDPRLPNFVLESGKPVLAMGYGMHALVQRLGGKVESDPRECQEERVDLKTWSGYHFYSFGSPTIGHTAMSCHSDRVTQMPKGFDCVASSRNMPFAVIADSSRDYYGFSFDVTPYTRYWSIFTKDICKCSGSWTMTHYIAKAHSDGCYVPLTTSIPDIVAATLEYRLNPDNFYCAIVSSSLLRVGELYFLKKECPFPIKEIELDDSELSEIRNTEHLMSTLQKIHQDELAKTNATQVRRNDFQHAFDGALFSTLLDDLYPSEIIALGRELGLSDALLNHCFITSPTGLACRCCDLSLRALHVLRNADFKLTQKVEQLDPTLQAGLILQQSGSTTYTAVVRVQDSNKKCAPLPVEFLVKISQNLRELSDLTQVLYDITFE